MLSIVEWADGLLLTAKDFGVKDLGDLDTETVINGLMKLGEADGIKFAGKGSDCGDQTFQLGGPDVFSWEPDEEDEDGNLCVLIEVIEDD